MAKKKTEAPAVEQEEVVAVEGKVEEQTKGMTEKEKTEKFIDNQLRAINRMKNKAKAKRVAARVLNNRKGL